MFKILSCSLLALSLAFNSAPVLLNTVTSPIGAVDVSADAVLTPLEVSEFTNTTTYGYTIADIEALLEVVEVVEGDPQDASNINDPAYTVSWVVTDDADTPQVVDHSNILTPGTYTFTASLTSGTDTHEFAQDSNTATVVISEATITAVSSTIELDNSATTSADVITALTTSNPTVTEKNAEEHEFVLPVEWTFPQENGEPAFKTDVDATNDFTGTIAAVADSYDSITVTATVTVIASATNYTITFNYNDEDTTANTTATTAEGKVTLPTPTRDGFTFVGWATTDDATTADVTATTVFDANTTVYAVWTIVPTVTPPPTVSPAPEVTVGYTITVTPSGSDVITDFSYKLDDGEVEPFTTTSIAVTEGSTLVIYDKDNNEVYNTVITSSAPITLLSTSINTTELEDDNASVDTSDLASSGSLPANTTSVALTVAKVEVIEDTVKDLGITGVETVDAFETKLATVVGATNVETSSAIIAPSLTYTTETNETPQAVTGSVNVTLTGLTANANGTMKLIRISSTGVVSDATATFTTPINDGIAMIAESEIYDATVSHNDGDSYIMVIESADVVETVSGSILASETTLSTVLKTELENKKLTFTPVDKSSGYGNVVTTAITNSGTWEVETGIFYAVPYTVQITETITPDGYVITAPTTTFTPVTGATNTVTFDIAKLQETNFAFTGATNGVKYSLFVYDATGSLVNTTSTTTTASNEKATFAPLDLELGSKYNVVVTGEPTPCEETQCECPTSVIYYNGSYTVSTTAFTGALVETSNEFDTSKGSTHYNGEHTFLNDNNISASKINSVALTLTQGTVVGASSPTVTGFDSNSSLTTPPSSTVDGYTVGDFIAGITVTGYTILDGGKVQVTIQTNATDYIGTVIVHHLDSNGKHKNYYTPTMTNGTVTFTVESFSSFAIYKTTATGSSVTPPAVSTTTPSTGNTSSGGSTYSSAYHESGSVRVNGTYITELRNVLVGELVNLNNIKTVNGRDVLAWYYDEAMTQEITNTSTFVITSSIISNGLYAKTSGSVSETLPDGSTNAGAGNTGSTYVPSVVPSTWAKLLGKLF